MEHIEFYDDGFAKRETLMVIIDILGTSHRCDPTLFLKPFVLVISKSNSHSRNFGIRTRDESGQVITALKYVVIADDSILTVIYLYGR